MSKDTREVSGATLSEGTPGSRSIVTATSLRMKYVPATALAVAGVTYLPSLSLTESFWDPRDALAFMLSQPPHPIAVLLFIVCVSAALASATGRFGMATLFALPPLILHAPNCISALQMAGQSGQSDDPMGLLLVAGIGVIVAYTLNLIAFGMTTVIAYARAEAAVRRRPAAPRKIWPGSVVIGVLGLLTAGGYWWATDGNPARRAFSDLHIVENLLAHRGETMDDLWIGVVVASSPRRSLVLEYSIVLRGPVSDEVEKERLLSVVDELDEQVGTDVQGFFGVREP